MSVKIKISYEYPEELKLIVKKLGKDVKNVKVSRQQSGRFKRAYIDIKEGCDVTTDMI